MSKLLLVISASLLLLVTLVIFTFCQPLRVNYRKRTSLVLGARTTRTADMVVQGVSPNLSKGTFNTARKPLRASLTNLTYTRQTVSVHFFKIRKIRWTSSREASIDSNILQSKKRRVVIIVAYLVKATKENAALFEKNKIFFCRTLYQQYTGLLAREESRNLSESSLFRARY
jgi:hypothetical protein